MRPPESLPEILILFELDGFFFGIDALNVERVVRAVEIAPVPGLPSGVIGVVHVRGKVLPVFDLRGRLGLAPRAVRASDHFIVLRSAGRQVAVVVDEVADVVPASMAGTISAPAVLPGLDSVEGWMKINGERIMIHDINKFLTTREMAELENALKTTST